MWPAIIGAGASLLGGFLNQSSADRAAKADRAWQEKVAKEGLEWKVESAKRAGIHPLAALGAPLFNPSPVSVGGGGIGDAVSDMGQNIGRALEAYEPANVRAAAVEERMAQLQLSNMELQNAALASDIALRRQAGHPPAVPGNVTRPGEVGPNRYPAVGLDWRTGGDATAEQIERDYGDIAQNLYGAGRLVKDFATANVPQWMDTVDTAIKNVVLNAIGGIGRPFVNVPSRVPYAAPRRGRR